MDQLRDFSDTRLLKGCIYCGGLESTREHVPSKVLLDAPYPENLPVVSACIPCNNGFSSDEEYVACLIESVITGSTEPNQIQRRSVANILLRSPALRARIEKAKYQTEGLTHFSVEKDRLQNVIVKLARGHAAFELSQICRNEPTSVWWSPITLLSAENHQAFHSAHIDYLLGEIGSRNTQRQYVIQMKLQGEDGNSSKLGLLATDWVDVQDERYRYLAVHESEDIRIRIVIREYLACEVVWSEQ
jgi:hypothetical protein